MSSPLSEDVFKKLSWTKLIPSELMSRGRDLADMGTNSIGWIKKDALEVIKILSENRYKILGGDVIDISKQTPYYTYDNWSCDKETKDITDWNKMVRISYKIANNYITKYREGRRKIMYDIICANPEEYAHIQEMTQEQKRILDIRIKKHDGFIAKLKKLISKKKGFDTF